MEPADFLELMDFSEFMNFAELNKLREQGFRLMKKGFCPLA